MPLPLRLPFLRLLFLRLLMLRTLLSLIPTSLLFPLPFLLLRFQSYPMGCVASIARVVGSSEEIREHGVHQCQEVRRRSEEQRGG